MEIVSSSTPHTATPCEPRAVRRLARSVLHLVDRQTASSCKLETVISRLEGSVQEALAGKELGEEAVINLRPESKETSVNAAKDQRHFIEGRCKKEKKAKNCKKKKEAAAASASTAPSSSRST